MIPADDYRGMTVELVDGRAIVRRATRAAEVTVRLPPVAAAPVLSNAAIRRDGERVGVWQLVDGRPRFVEVSFGAADLDGNVQVLDGLMDGDQVIVYSEKAISARSRIRVVEQIPGSAP